MCIRDSPSTLPSPHRTGAEPSASRAAKVTAVDGEPAGGILVELEVEVGGDEEEAVAVPPRATGCAAVPGATSCPTGVTRPRLAKPQSKSAAEFCQDG